VRQLQPQVQRLVYASSAAVYGPIEAYEADKPKGSVTLSPGHLVTLSSLPDDARLLPTTHYGVFKCCNEGNARIYYQDHGLSSIGLRPWTVYGVGRDFGMTSEPTKAIKCLALNRPYRIRYGGWQDLQFTDDVAKTFIRCLEVPFHGAKSYNLRGHVVEMPELHRAMCDGEPRAAELITYGEKQLPIAYDLSDDALQRELGPMPRTSLRDGIHLTLERFRELNGARRLDTTDLDG
jgi:nucleoside-diphosphate-sugar epimerase